MKKIYVYTYFKPNKSVKTNTKRTLEKEEEFEKEIAEIEQKDDKQIMNKLLMLLSTDLIEES